MNQQSRAFELARFVHDTVWMRNGVLTHEDLQPRSVERAYGTGNSRPEQVVAFSRNRDSADPRSETLSRSSDSRYYFNVNTGPEYTGELSDGRHMITPESDVATWQRLLGSMMVRELIDVCPEDLTKTT